MTHKFKSVHASEVHAEIDFAHRAAQWFAAHPESSTFGEIAPGEFFAIRWGMGEDCVMVCKLDEFHMPTNYQQIIKKVQP